MKYDNIPYNQEEHNYMVNYFKNVVPLDRDWVLKYLDLIRYIIDKIELHNSDKNFVLTLPQKPSWPVFLPVTIGDRYVLTGYYRYSQEEDDNPEEDPSIAIMIQNRFWENLTEKQQNTIEEKIDLFKPYKYESNPPVFLFLKSISCIEDLINAWTDSMMTEKNRKYGSMQRKRHRSMMYKLVTDPEYQKEFFHEVF